MGGCSSRPGDEPVFYRTMQTDAQEQFEGAAGSPDDAPDGLRRAGVSAGFGTIPSFFATEG